MPMGAATSAVIAAALAIPGGAQAQAYPVKPLRIVTSGVGGAGDIVSRFRALPAHAAGKG